MMMKQIAKLILLCICVYACKSSQPDEVVYNPHVQAFTSGMVSIQTSITVRLSETLNVNDLDDKQRRKLFSISPSVDGEVVQVDDQTLEFRPTDLLKVDKTYEVEFDVKKALGSDVEKKDREFKFSFTTIKPSIFAQSQGLVLYDETNTELYQLKVEVISSDYVDNAAVESSLKSNEVLKPYTPKWEHDNNRIHRLTFDSIRAGEKSVNVVMTFKGSAIDADQDQEVEVRIPSKYEFALLGTTINSEPQSIVCRFSAPIDSKQSLESYFTLGQTALTFKVRNNEVHIYPSTKVLGSATLTVRAGLKSTKGGKFETDHEEEVVFETLNPEVKFTGPGSILPSSAGVTLPFQAVSLKSVQVKIIKIYETNVMQFLQVNQLDGKRDLKRAGRIVKVMTFRLDEKLSVQELKRWNTFSLDLGKLIATEPGAIYRVEIGFTKKSAILDCDARPNGEVEEVDASDQELFTQEETSYDPPTGGSIYYDDYYDYYDDEYYSDYQNRDNPCSNAFYGARRSVSKNILASDVGLIAKVDGKDIIHATVTKLSDVSPLSGVNIEAYNYQQQLIGQGTTNGDGFAQLSVKGKVFVLMAKHGKERAYLQMLDGYALSMSRFDVGGSQIQKGVKGFIYGERGVWRPGDTLFLGFVLQNKDKSIPANHPVNLEITNARGQVVNKQTKTAGVNGFYTFRYVTGQDDPTGNWEAKVSIGGVSFTKTLKIETIKPNRLKIELKFDQSPIRLSQGITGRVISKWLHGSPAKNLKTEITMRLSAVTTTFKAYSNYVFDNPTKTFASEEKNIVSDRLNSEGEMSFRGTSIANTNAPGMLQANFITRVMEEGGDISIDNYTTTVSPYSSYVGILSPKGTGYANMLETDKAQRYDIVSVDEKGLPVNRSLTVNVYKMGWSWWWSSSNGQLANFSQSSYNRSVFTKSVNTVGGKASFSYTATKYEYGYYLIEVRDENSGHSCAITSYYDWPNWGGRPSQDGNEGANLLSFKSDKESYKVGEEATITLPTAVGSRVLLSIENGSEILDSRWYDATGTKTEIKVPITANMTPNVYVSVTLVQAHAQTQNDSPIRLYGVLPIMAEDPNTILKPNIDLPATLRPEEEYTVQVSESNKKEMTYTLAVVDEGLLDITRFATPNPWNYFYAREALGIRTWDMYDAVLGAYGGKIQQLFAIGGDDALSGNRPKVSRFKPVVTFLGPFTLDKGKTNSHKIKMPNYIGSVRVMVVAANEQAYGSAEKAVPVRKPLMAMATLPRVLGPGEEVDLPVNIFALEPSVKNVKINVEANDLLEASETSKSLSFSEIGDQMVNFRLKVKERTGKATVKVTATSGSEKSVFEIELEVRNPNPSITVVNKHVLPAGQEWSISNALVGMDGTNTATLEASFLPPINLASRMRYLLAYPHGCLEQTTSTVFPQLYLSSVVSLTKEEIDKTTSNIKIGIEKLKSFASLSGGFTYWPGDRHPNLWATSYAGDFLLEAKAKGYTIPSGMLDGWVKFQQKESRNWSAKPANTSNSYYNYGQSDLDQAYRLYTLAKAKSPEMGPMNRLKELSGLSVAARWTLAAAYALSNQNDVALKLIEGATTKTSAYSSSFSQSYGSVDRDKALLVDALVKMQKKEKAFELVREISEALNGDQWMGTQTTAYCLMAIARYAESDKNHKSIELEYTINGKTEKVNTDKQFWTVDFGKLKTATQIKVKNKSGNSIFIQLASSGIPVAGGEVLTENGLKIAVSYWAQGSVNVSKLTQGTNFTAIVSVSNTGVIRQAYKNIALSQIFPSGWEITNERLLGLESSGKYDYCDIRDDRVYTYFDLGVSEKRQFEVKLTAAYKGRFYLPAVKAEAMYDGSINGNSVGQWVEVE